MINRSDALFTCLLTDLGFPDGQPSPFSTYQDYAKSYLARDVYKKLVTRISDHADCRALDKFIAVNESCRDWKMEYNGSWDEELIGTLKDVLYRFWNPCGQPLVSSFASCLQDARPGPGASIGANGNDFYTKMFSSLLTSTSSDLYDTYRSHFQDHPLWSSAETGRADRYGECEVVRGSRISYVPKSNDISRTICIEPSLNMFYQLGLGARLESRLRSFFGIDLSLQPIVNRELARLGSMDGSYATIDLSSASDSMSLRMLEEVLPADMWAWLNLLRSNETETERGWLELHMVSTMGNGFTFPLQTTLFAAVVLVAMKYHGIKPIRTGWSRENGSSKHQGVREVLASLGIAPEERPSLERLGNFSVFGDDIIVPKEIFGTVVRLLGKLGFTVNPDKTFVEGPFRESCGCDYFLGHDVRPVYIKSLDTQQDRYVAINLLNDWTARTGIPLPHAVQYLVGSVRYLPVPFQANLDSGIRMPESILDQDLVKRTESGSYLYRCRIGMPTKVKVLDSSFVFPKSKRKKEIMYNPDGLYLTLLRGDLADGSFSIRHDRVRYRTGTRVALWWDYMPPAPGLKTPGFTRRQWNTAVWQNLLG